MSKTTITVSPKVRAAYAAMSREYPGLSLTDFYDQAATFFLAYRDEASLQPMIRHLSTVSGQLTAVQHELQHIRPPPG